MSNDERPDSLAEQAAAWVPPWQRPAPAPAEDATPPATAVGAADLGAQVPLQGPLPAKIEVVEERGGGGEDGAAGGVPGSGRKRSGPRGRSVPEPAAELDDAELRGALEAILLVVDEPVSELVLAQVLEQPAERIGPMLDEIAAGFTAAGHGFELRRAAGGWRLYTRPEYATYVERFVLDGQSVRLTQAALETLAVVAYKQPVTRSRISAIRGVNCDGVIRTLVTRGLVEECGTESDSGAHLYRTSTLFLEKLGLNSLDDLPPLAPFLPDDVEELADAAR
ncbi:SMC-Scp complex subunit ScpB [Verrucosispora sp. CWR15]|uniref:SMC-Scp complex subunit ScpB n=1 Tax=Verrucosispora sioxanthis TaxID=2499994 RepID=A0A6M1LDS2_9ACTN|nr:SMC-Scp complex subunit ScpB [Verrucosispora sioxanthis]NEE67114.1 SMC-Scp complex subunit ScpB [Verrucosispora sioxanthis]NGM16224.1 SMC-Scp complex subunit ScpB [Verrucosispora sioxanthis]